MATKFNMIAAVCEGWGIGANGGLPWKLKEEMAYFKRITSEVSPETTGKKNAVIMGRRTWESIPSKFRPLPDRINVVISSTMDSSNSEEKPETNILIFRSLYSALSALSLPPYSELCASLWIIGGSSLYNEGIKHPGCHRLYITHIRKAFECDAFFPEIPPSYEPISVEGVPAEIQSEKDVNYEYKVYERIIPSK